MTSPKEFSKYIVEIGIYIFEKMKYVTIIMYWYLVPKLENGNFPFWSIKFALEIYILTMFVEFKNLIVSFQN